MKSNTRNRRTFIKNSTAFALTGWTLSSPSQTSASGPTQDTDLFIVGPKEGFSPQVGTLVSMMNWTRRITIEWVKQLSMQDLDFLVDPKANSIGALLLHIIAQEKECQVQTFKWDRAEVFNQADAIVSKLGDQTREKIKGNEVSFYMTELRTVRQKSIEEFKRRDDEWLMKIDENHPWGVPVNHYCQWFHVLEHECQHAGQISLIKNRLPN